jgi:hypothetical protein
LSQKIGRQDNIGNALLGLAHVESEEGNAQRALSLVTAANDIFVRLAMQPQVAESQELIDKLET